MDADFSTLDFPGLDWGGYSREEVLDLLTEAALDSLDGTGADFAAQPPARFTPLTADSDPPPTDPAAFFVLAERDGAAAALAAWEEARFYSPDQPRDDRGRWTSGGGGGESDADPFRGGMTHAARSGTRTASAAHARDFVAKGGPASNEEVAALGHHLARLTVAQLHALRAEHGLPAAGAWKLRKPDLVRVLGERFAAHRAALPTSAARELAAAVAGKPEFTESKYRPSDATHAYTHTGTGFRASAHPDGRFHVFGRGLTHEGVHDTAAAAVVHAANPPPKPPPDYHRRVADVETAARQGAVADAAARREGAEKSRDRGVAAQNRAVREDAARAADKAPHEMTFKEYMASHGGPTPGNIAVYNRAVKAAARRREPLSDRVLKDHPEVAAKLGRVFRAHELTRWQHGNHSMFHPAYPDAHADHRREVVKAVRAGKPVPAEVLAEYPDISRRARFAPAAPGAGGGAGPKAGGFDAHAEGQSLKALADTHVGAVAAAARSAGDFRARGARVSEASARAEAALVGRVKDLVGRAPHAAALKDAVRAFGLVPVGSGKAALGEQLRTALLDRLNIMVRTATSTRGAPFAADDSPAERPVRFVPLVQPAEAARA